MIKRWLPGAPRILNQHIEHVFSGSLLGLRFRSGHGQDHCTSLPPVGSSADATSKLEEVDAEMRSLKRCQSLKDIAQLMRREGSSWQPKHASQALIEAGQRVRRRTDPQDVKAIVEVLRPQLLGWYVEQLAGARPPPAAGPRVLARGMEAMARLQARSERSVAKAETLKAVEGMARGLVRELRASGSSSRESRAVVPALSALLSLRSRDSQLLEDMSEFTLQALQEQLAANAEQGGQSNGNGSKGELSVAALSGVFLSYCNSLEGRHSAPATVATLAVLDAAAPQIARNLLQVPEWRVHWMLRSCAAGRYRNEELLQAVMERMMQAGAGRQLHDLVYAFAELGHQDARLEGYVRQQHEAFAKEALLEEQLILAHAMAMLGCGDERYVIAAVDLVNSGMCPSIEDNTLLRLGHVLLLLLGARGGSEGFAAAAAAGAQGEEEEQQQQQQQKRRGRRHRKMEGEQRKLQRAWERLIVRLGPTVSDRCMPWLPEVLAEQHMLRNVSLFQDRSRGADTGAGHSRSAASGSVVAAPYLRSALAQEVLAVLKAMQSVAEVLVEPPVADGLMFVDALVRPRSPPPLAGVAPSSWVVLEIDGHSHFTNNAPWRPTGRALARSRFLRACGYRVVSLPWYRWAELGDSFTARARFLELELFGTRTSSEPARRAASSVTASRRTRRAAARFAT